MGLSYHWSIRAPAAVPAAELADFLANVEGDAKLLGFAPTIVVNGPFDTPERREFARRVARPLTVEDPRLRDVVLAPGSCWSHDLREGCCRLAPEHGVLLVVTDQRGRETVFGFLRYPRFITKSDGAVVMETPGGGDWRSGSFVDCPDHRYRAIIRRFAAAGFVEDEKDEFAPPERGA
ncbi:MAG: hypothetical protein KF715_19895 [Candidatus Didemnitutus sp.]|nr:hypothetical protein [Candidatus Didemnitutus sp.]